jgi:hypothetical protein
MERVNNVTEGVMPENAERRANNEKFSQDVRDFMIRSDLYRDNDKGIQENILAEAKRTNGRISDLEDWREKIDERIQNNKEAAVEKNKSKAAIKDNFVLFVNICLAVIMAVSAVVMIFKK